MCLPPEPSVVFRGDHEFQVAVPDHGIRLGRTRCLVLYHERTGKGNQRETKLANSQ